MASLQGRCESYKAALRDARLPEPPTKTDDVLSRFFTRELAIASKLLKQVLEDLDLVAGVCAGEIRPTNDTRSLCQALGKGESDAAFYQHAHRAESFRIWDR
jgi:hypothetical protein